MLSFRIDIASVSRTCICSILFATAVALPTTARAAEKLRFAIDDYFGIERIVELSPSSNGTMMAYIVERLSLEENEPVRKVYISSAAPGATPLLIDHIQKARNIAWIPNTQELAFLLDDSDTTQVYSINLENKKVRQFTRGKESVLSYRFAPNGGALAWLAKSDLDEQSPPLQEKLRVAETGVVIDTETTSAFHFLNPNWTGARRKIHSMLWFKRLGANAISIETPGQVKTFHWSSDGSKLSLTYVRDNTPRDYFLERTNIGIFDIRAKKFSSLFPTQSPLDANTTRFFTGGEWIPGKDKMIVGRVTERDAWVRYFEWTIIDVVNDQRRSPDKLDWREIEIYGSERMPSFVPLDENTIYSNHIVNARWFLYQINPLGVRKANIFRDIHDSVSAVQFSADFNTAIFVKESFTQPPEIYIWREKRPVHRRITQLNQHLADRQLPSVTEVHWKSRDGTMVQGWLLEPIDRRTATNGRWPLLTYLHGGPSGPVTNSFAPSFKMGRLGISPYPFEVYALHGIAVFIPNYRGTKSFGNKFGDPNNLDGEPVDDVISGIEKLVADGTADPTRLAISGTSHGAWLGPLVMAKAKIFQCASFFEGATNLITAYSQTPGWLNRVTHDVKFGDSLYHNPLRYIELSPEFHFEGLDTAVMFEAGARSLATTILGAAKAARRAGMPMEFVVYPKTGHGITAPHLQKDSAEHNLDWFRFWLQGYEDPDPEREAQYARWRKMRDEQCERLKGEDTPSYCRQ